MSWTWDSADSYNRKPLRFNLCGGFVSGLLHGYTTPQFYPKYGSPRAWQSGVDMPVQWQANTFYYSSSDFTGIMHAAAQVLMGSPRAPDLFDPGAGAFRADWAHTHGIYSQDIGGGQRKPWLISISSAGIYARELPHCAGTIGSTPAGTEKAFDASYFKSVYGFYPQPPGTGFFTLPGDWTQLADSTAVAAFYAKSAVYTRCGWAFNSTGLNAVNTCYEYESDATTHGYKFYEYVLTISTDVDGAPTSAALALNASGYARYVWNGTSDAPAALAVPGSDGFLIKFDFSLSDATKTVLGANGERVPLVSWYSAVDALDGLEHVNEDISTSAVSIGTLGDTDALPVGIYSEASYDETTGTSRGVVYRGDTPGAASGKDGSESNYLTYPIAAAIYAGGYLYDESSVYKIGNNATTWGGAHGGHSESVGIVAVGDRAAAYLYEYAESITEEAITQEYYGFVRGPENNDPANGSYQRSSLNGRTCTGGSCNGGTPTKYTHDSTATLTSGPRTKLTGAGDMLSGWIARFPSRWPGTIHWICGTSNWHEAGWCRDDITDESPLTPPATGDVYQGTRTETLTLRSVNAGADVTLFDNTEGPIDLNVATFTQILAPVDGNDYLFQTPSAEHMYCWSDSITGQIVYSDKMNGDTGADLDWVDTQTYPLASLTSTIMHSWVGVPGDSTT